MMVDNGGNGRLLVGVGMSIAGYWWVLVGKGGNVGRE